MQVGIELGKGIKPISKADHNGLNNCEIEWSLEQLGLLVVTPTINQSINPSHSWSGLGQMSDCPWVTQPNQCRDLEMAVCARYIYSVWWIMELKRICEEKLNKKPKSRCDMFV